MPGTTYVAMMTRDPAWKVALQWTELSSWLVHDLKIEL